MARLATVGPGRRVDVVPITFAWAGPDQLVTAVDHKPKTTTRLQRLRNIEAHPAVTVLFDHYDDADWSRLWWVRAQGTAAVVHAGDALGAAVDALVARYPQYRDVRPTGPAIWVEITDWHGWAA